MTGGLIVRLIDVVLIILFGFIAISDIQVKRQIKLPGATDKQEEENKQENPQLWVSITKNGLYSLKLDETPVIDNDSLRVLEKKLVAQMNSLLAWNKAPVVIIDPEPEAKIQETVRVIDLCEKHRFPKSININKALKTHE